MTSMTRADVAKLPDPGVPMVFLNCPFPIPGYLAIGPHAMDGARRIVEHLLTVHHHQQVAFIAGETGDPDPEDRERGWRDALRAHGRTDGPMIRTSFTLDGGYDAAQSMLNMAARPTAIFASSDLQAYGVLHAIHDQGLRIPDDVAVVSFDGTAESAHAWPPLTLVQQPLTTMAEAAISGLLGHDQPGHTLLDMNMIIRQSCGCHTAGIAAGRPVQ